MLRCEVQHARSITIEGSDGDTVMKDPGFILTSDYPVRDNVFVQLLTRAGAKDACEVAIATRAKSERPC